MRRTILLLMLVAAMSCLALGQTNVKGIGYIQNSNSSAGAQCLRENLSVKEGDTDAAMGGVRVTTYTFTNKSSSPCTLNGYPGVSAYRGASQVGPPATRNGGSHRTVTLTPGATAHAILRVTDWGAVCSTEVVADGLKVFPPGQTRSEPVPFSFGACAHRGVLSVGPVRAGVGIPGYTTS